MEQQERVPESNEEEFLFQAAQAFSEQQVEELKRTLRQAVEGAVVGVMDGGRQLPIADDAPLSVKTITATVRLGIDMRGKFFMLAQAGVKADVELVVELEKK